MEKCDGLHWNAKLARGHFDLITHDPPGMLNIAGWILSPEAEFGSIRVYRNGRHVGVAERTARPDVADAFPWIPHAAQSGFQVNVNLGASRPGHINIVGFQDERPLGQMPLLEGIPVPPAALMQRVAGTSDADEFKNAGFRLATDFLGTLRRHRDPVSVGRLLEWGCGCGRIFVHLVGSLPLAEVHGSDIDPEAIAWCGAHLPLGRFVVNGPHPPIAFKDATFDVILACSVFTHLTRKVQWAWLTELRRIMAPGGLLLASVHGEAALSNIPADMAQKVVRKGIVDELVDPTLDQIAPDNYYRSTFQTKAYTCQEWSKVFEIAEYVDAGVNGHQDLVVLRVRG